MVFRNQGLVVAATSSTATGDERWGYRRELLDLVEQHVLGAQSTVAPGR